MTDKTTITTQDGTAEPLTLDDRTAADGAAASREFDGSADTGVEVYEDGEGGLPMESEIEGALVLESNRRDPKAAHEGLGAAYAVQGSDIDSMSKPFELENFPGAVWRGAPVNGNDEYQELLDKAGRKLSKPGKPLSFAQAQEVTPIIMARTLFLEIVSGWTLGSGKPMIRKNPRTGEVVSRIFASGKHGDHRDTVDTHVWINGKRRRAKLTFELDSNGEIVDSESTRKRLLQAFPDIKDEIWAKCRDATNFPGLRVSDEEAQGN